MTTRRERRRAREERRVQDKAKVDTLRKLGANMSGCGCQWIRHPKYGDVLSLTCETHRGSQWVKHQEHDALVRMPRSGS